MATALRVTRTGVVPAATIAVLALVALVLRTAALVLFGVLAVLRGGFRTAEALGDRVPKPHWNPRRPRPIPAPGVSPR